MYNILYPPQVEDLPKPKREPKEVSLDPKDYVIDKGEYQISCSVVINFKSTGVQQELFLGKEVKLDRKKNLQDILDDMVDEYILTLNKNYGDDYDFLDTKTIDVKYFDGVPFDLIKLKQARLQENLLPGDIEVNSNPGQCVLDYMMTEISKVWPKYSRLRLIEDLAVLDGPANGYTVCDIMKWVEKRKTVSCYVLGLHNDVVKEVVSKHMELQLVFKPKDKHCFGVYDKELKNLVAHSKKLSLKKQVFEYSRYATYTVLETVNDYYGLIKRFAFLDEEDTQKAEQLKKVEVVYLSHEVDLCRLSLLIAEEFGFYLEYGEYNDALLVKMVNPANNQIIIAAENYHERKAVADALLAEKNLLEFRWQNQSWMNLATKLFQLRVGDIGESEYSPDMEIILDNYGLGPWIAKTGESVDTLAGEEAEAFDGRLRYTSELIRNRDPWCFYSRFNDVEPFDGKLLPGEYCLDKPLWLGTNIKIGQWQPLNMILHLIKMKEITKENILYMIRPYRTLPADTFKSFAVEILERWPEHAKYMVNHFIGALNRRVVKSNEVAMTSSSQSAMAAYVEDPEHIKMTKVGSVWLVRKQSMYTVDKGNSPLWRQVISGGIISLDITRRAIMGPDTKIISYNTDSITVVRPNPEFVKTVVEKKIARPGDICREPLKAPRGKYIQEMIECEPFVYDPCDWKKGEKETWLDTGASGCGIAMPGAGKTTLAVELMGDDKSDGMTSVAATHTNCGSANIRARGVDSFTLDSMFPKDKSDEWMNTLRSYDAFTLEEFSMVPKKWFGLFYRWKKENPKRAFRMFGDPNQCVPIEDDKVWFSYLNSKIVRLLCDQNLCELEYIDGCGRYDRTAYNQLVYLKHTGKLDKYYFETPLYGPHECDFNIVATRKYRDKINAEWYAVNSVGKKIGEFNDFKFFIGMPIISHVNLKTLHIYNSERY